MRGSLCSNYIRTLGADISVKELLIEYDNKEFLLKLSIWDVAGQTIFENINQKYFQ